MTTKFSFTAIALMLALIVAVNCSSKEEKIKSTEQPEETSTSSVDVSVGGGIEWSAPSSWETLPDRQMRLKTYSLETADGDDENAECAVYYFGPTEGGSVESNFERWALQMEQPDGGNSIEQALFSEFTANGLEIKTIDVTGIYLAPGGPAMQSTGKKPGFRLLGAVCQGPEGSVFFKMTGPEKTVDESKDDFMELLKSIKPRDI